MAKTYIVNGRIYKETGERTVIVDGSILEGTTSTGGTITGSGTPSAQSATCAGTAERELISSGTPASQSATTSGTAIRELTSSGTN